jgi:hypothetical protein
MCHGSKPGNNISDCAFKQDFGSVCRPNATEHLIFRAEIHFEAGLESPDASFSFDCSG